MKQPASICGYPSCKQIATNKGRCAAHQREERPKEHSRTSTTRNNDIYNSAKWKKLRHKKFLNNPLCQDCLELNITTPMDCVDHVKEITDYPELAYTYLNLRSLCYSCHAIKTAREAKYRIHPKELTTNELFRTFGINK
ncbi:HNH endonuclease [Moritella viscosa]|uniref:HNH endonuclease n=1 Tax=Moritella viscosa TaxID=80854 RepID=UPI0005090626|nr:HNH endonuclease [Moritella viscosa]CED59839.1 putative uncharacterized phage endonuclease [Moritella viscosa]